MSGGDGVDAATLVLLLLGALLLVPLLMMGVGIGGMVGYGGMMGTWGGNGWWPLVGLLVPVLVVLVVLGGGYLIVRGLSRGRQSRDPAVEELRLAYARGDISEEEFESRRKRLDREE